MDDAKTIQESPQEFHLQTIPKLPFCGTLSHSYYQTLSEPYELACSKVSRETELNSVGIDQNCYEAVTTLLNPPEPS